MRIRFIVAGAGVSLTVLTANMPAAQEPPGKTASATRVVLLGTGNPTVSPEEIRAEMLARYSGHFVTGRDLDVY